MDSKFLKIYNVVIESLVPKRNADDETKEQFSEDFSSILTKIINEIKNDFSNVRGIEKSTFLSKNDVVTPRGNNNYVIKVPNSIRVQVIDKISKYLNDNIGTNYEFKINDVINDPIEQKKDFNELTNQPNEVKNVQSTKSSAGEVIIPAAAKDMKDKDETDFYQFYISIVAKPSDGARSISGDDINTNLTELLPCIYWNYSEKFDNLDIETIINTIKTMDVNDISKCFLSSDTGGPGKAKALLEFISTKIDTLDKQVKKIVYDKIKVSFSIYKKMIELYPEYRSNQCIWTAKKKPEGYDGSPADLMIKMDEITWIEISLKAGAASSHPHLLNTSLNGFFKFLNETFGLKYSLTNLFLEIISNRSLISEEEYEKIRKILPDDFNENYEVKTRSTLNVTTRAILNQILNVKENPTRTKNIIKTIVQILLSKINECCENDNDKLITIVKYLLNLNSSEGNFVMLKGFPNGEPAEVSKPDSNELVFNNIEITPTDSGLIFSGFKYNSITKIVARPRTAGTGIPGFLNFSFRVN